MQGNEACYSKFLKVRYHSRKNVPISAIYQNPEQIKFCFPILAYFKMSLRFVRLISLRSTRLLS